jgi:anti-sigma B factor antagonist
LPDREYVAVLGELDIYTAPSLERALLEVEDARPLLVVDLAGLGFIDSTGLSVLLAASERARRQGRRLIVVRPPLPALRVFTLTKVDAGMECVDGPLDVPAQRDDRDATRVAVLKLWPRLDEPKSARRS